MSARWDENLFARADNENRLPGGRLPEGSCVTDNLGRRLCSQVNTSTAGETACKSIRSEG